MSSNVTLTGNDWSCSQFSLSNQSTYIGCKIQGSASPISAPQVFEYRHSACDLPGGAINPMGDCSYKDLFSSMQRCGCPVCDLKINLDLWDAYHKKVYSAVKDRIDQGVKEITVTSFASGYFLIDFYLLDQIFNKTDCNTWDGTLNIQFVDPK